MNVTPDKTPLAPAETPPAPAGDSLPGLAASAADLVHAWRNLLDREVALAKRSLRGLLIGALALPVLALSVWLVLSALLIGIMYTFCNSWLLALSLGAAVQVLLLAILLRQLRRWWRDLSLPQSRAALVRAMERMS